ncbi:MAG: hypothetical protein KAR65_00285, partial [Anaerolineales bacterium]|nr:hypothetical protein [Anaerolineales bacterium]
MEVPILSIVVFTPIVFGVALFFFPAERHREIRIFALAGATVALLLSLWAYFTYDQVIGGYQLVERYPWVPRLGISYHVGVDGMNAPLVLLTGIV